MEKAHFGFGWIIARSQLESISEALKKVPDLSTVFVGSEMYFVGAILNSIEFNDFAFINLKKVMSLDFPSLIYIHAQMEKVEEPELYLFSENKEEKINDEIL